MRWFREMRTPALKCARVGHDVRVMARSGYVRSNNSWRYVCDSVEETRQECRRCGEALTPWIEAYRLGVSSLHADSDTFKRIDAGGDWVRFWEKRA